MTQESFSDELSVEVTIHQQYDSNTTGPDFDDDNDITLTNRPQLQIQLGRVDESRHGCEQGDETSKPFQTSHSYLNLFYISYCSINFNLDAFVNV